ncbi:hypothetical protein ACFSTC_53755 [Nonomuraea ferruginea]
MPEQTWAPVVFGRTAGADVWWRVRPPGADRQWLENAIHTVIAAAAGDWRAVPASSSPSGRARGWWEWPAGRSS